MPTLLPNHFHLAEHKRNVWQVYAAAAPADLLDPAYWAHVAQKLSAYDRVEALSEHGDWWAEYLVLETGAKWARVCLLREQDLRKAAAPAVATEYEIKHRGVKGHSVIRVGDKAVIKDGFKTRDEAEDFLIAHRKAVAA